MEQRDLDQLRETLVKKLAARGIDTNVDEVMNDIASFVSRERAPREEFPSVDAMIRTRDLETLKKVDPENYKRNKNKMMFEAIQAGVAAGTLEYRDGKFVKTDKYTQTGVRQLDNRIAKITGTKKSKYVK